MQQAFAQSLFSKFSLFAFVGASKNYLTWMRLLFIFLIAGGATNAFSQVIAPNNPVSSPQFAGCDDLNPVIENYEPCCYRLHIDNTSDCYPSLRVGLFGGSFASWTANAAAGWTGTVVSPGEILLTHSSGQVPMGGSTPIVFCLVPGTSPDLQVHWEFTCVPAASCIAFYTLDGCPDPNDASITGVKYRECGSSPYINQPVIPNWKINLLDINGNTIAQQQTASDGTYAFYDLPGGTYTAEEEVKAGWTAKVPASGQATFNLIPSQQKIQNFGNCPSCSCDSIYMQLTQLAGILDTSTYFLTFSNNGAYCFSFINIQVNTGQLEDWSLFLPGWTAVLQGPNLLKLSPPGPLLPGGGGIPLSFRVSGPGVHNITVSTVWNTGGGNMPCNRNFVFQSPPEVLSLNCCPAGTEQGSELVLDGNFNSIVPIFSWSSNDYINAPVNGPGHIAVVKSKDIPSINPVWACASKSGSPDDRFLIVDASTTAGAVAWEQQITTTPGTEYAYGAFLNNIVIPNSPLPNPNVRLQIVEGGSGNNVLDAATKNLSQSPDNWVSLCGHWTSPEVPPATPYRLQIVAMFPIQSGHDFAVDCISFRSCTPVVPCSVSIATTQLNECGSIQWTANASGPAPYTYLWSNSLNTPSITTQEPCGTSTYTVTVTCADGMTATASTTVVVSDNVKPTINCPNSLTVQGYSDGNGICQSWVTGIGATATDNCTVTDLTYYINSPPPIAGDASGAHFNEGMSTVVYTATDGCGNTASCSFKVTVECHSCYCADAQGPELVTNGNFSNLGGFFSDYTNNCISNTEGQYCITNNPINANPGFEPCDSIFNGKMFVVNGALPSSPAKKVWCTPMPVPVTFGTNYFFRYELTSVVAANPAQLQLTINGLNVGSIAQSPPNPCFWQQFCQTWTPHLDEFSAQVCLIDLTSVAPGNDFALDNISFRSCSTPPCIPDFSWVSDPCLNTQFFNNSTPTPSSGSSLWTFGDNTSSSDNDPVHTFTNCDSTYTVCLTICEKTICKEVAFMDNVPPTITCPPDLTFDCDENPTDLGHATSNDNCGLPLTNVGHVSLNACGSVIAEQWVATDKCGNSSFCVQTVTFKDMKPPVIICPSNTTVNTNSGQCYYSGPIPQTTATDACDPNPAILCYFEDNNGGSIFINPQTQFPKGLTNIYCDAKDKCGNQSSCSYTLTVVDNQPPTISCPQNLTVIGTINPQGLCKAIVNGIAPTTSDNCPMLNLSYFITPMDIFGLGDASGTNFMKGVSTVKYTVTDMGGNTATCSFDITVSCPNCPDNLLQNGDFQQGLNDPSDELIYFWYPIQSSTPQVVTTDGCNENGCIQMWGNQLTGEGIHQGFNFIKGCTYAISYCGKQLPLVQLNAQLRFRATNGWSSVSAFNYLNCPPLTCSDIGYSPDLTSNWVNYPPIIWTAPDNYNNFVVSVWNKSAVSNGDSVSWAKVDDICIRKIGCIGNCSCGTYSALSFNYEHGYKFSAVCDTLPPIYLDCPNKDQQLYFTGKFNCAGADCPNTAPVDWELWHINPDVKVASGSATADPWFGINLLSSFFTDGGFYQLRMTGHCGSKLCPCVINFYMPTCTEECNCGQIVKDVTAGFWQAVWHDKCQVCFTPKSLKDCDRVEWSILPGDTSYTNPVAVTGGNQTFCYYFPGPGTYTVVMHVYRPIPGGTYCEYVYRKKITVNCPWLPNCENQVFLNPEFGAGASLGILEVNDPGHSNDWLKVTGSPVIDTISPAPPGVDGWYISLSGNADTYDAIRTDQGYCLEKDTVIISMRIRPQSLNGDDIEIKPGTMIFVNFVRGNDFLPDSCVGNNCYEVACLQVPEDVDDWVDFQFDYDLRDVLGFDSCSSASAPKVSIRPVIYVANWLGDNQGTDTKSRVLVENFCLKGEGVVKTKTPDSPSTFRLFPNPTTGDLSVELPSPATVGMRFHITDLAGRLVLEKEAEPGSAMQTIRTGDLPPGLYFLQVVSEGKVLAVKKFVKQ